MTVMFTMKISCIALLTALLLSGKTTAAADVDAVAGVGRQAGEAARKRSAIVRRSEYLGPLKGLNHRQKGHSYQGMDVYGHYAVSCQNQGIATIYLLGKDTFSRTAQFKLASFNSRNHANVASFGTEKFDAGDPFPLLYVSHCHRKTIDGRKDLCFVERIAPDMQSSELVQTIFYDDTDKDFGYALQWVVDRQRGLLCGYGNTVNNTDSTNRHRIAVFPLPSLDEGPVVMLKPEDAIENYLLEDYMPSDAFKPRFNPIGQGLDIRDGLLYMPTGLGTEKHPSILYIWDLNRRTMKALDLSGCTTGELEDIAVLSRKVLLLQSQDGLFRIRLRKGFLR